MSSMPPLASDDLDHARAEIERMARAATSPDGARGWWHAARIVRLFGNAARAMTQQARHARFFAATAPDKAAAYRGAMAIVARHTGESLADFAVAACEPAFASTAKDKNKSKKKRGPGWMGWMGSGTAGANKETSSPAGSSSQPFYPSRPPLLLHRADHFSSASIPFTCG